MMWHGDLCWEATNGKYKWTAVDWSSESSVGFISWIELNIAMKNAPKKMGQQPLKTMIIIINNCLNSSEQSRLVKKNKTIKQIDFHSLFWYVFFFFLEMLIYFGRRAAVTLSSRSFKNTNDCCTASFCRPSVQTQRLSQHGRRCCADRSHHSSLRANVGDKHGDFQRSDASR